MAETKLRRTLGLWEVVFFGSGSILGAGIYSIVGKVAGHGGNMIWLSFGFAAVTALMSVFSYAELSSMFPKAGAEYVYAKEAANKKVATALGLIISTNGIISGATVSIAFAGYFGGLFGIGLLLPSLGVIAAVLAVNIVGIRQSSIMNIVFTVIELAGLLIVIYVAAPTIGTIDYFEMPEGGMNGILVGAALSYFAFIGFEEIVKLGEETKEPRKNIPRALFIATGTVTVFYLVVAASAVSVVPHGELKSSQHPLADVVGTGFGSAGIILISAIALFSTTNTILSNMIGSSRVIMELGGDNSWLKKLAYVSPKRKTPVTALILCTVIMCCFALIGRLELVALIANFFVFLTFLAVNSIAIVLRASNENAPRPYRIPLNIGRIPMPSILGVILTLILFGYTVYGIATSAF